MELKTNRKKAQGIKTKTECVKAAIEVFARKGFHLAKLDDIAEAAGVTRGALYWHYRTKEAFLIAVLETLSAHWTRERLQEFPVRGPADLLISRFFVQFARGNRRAPWLNRLGLITAIDADNIHPRVAEIARNAEATNRWFFKRLVEYGQRTDVIDGKLDASRLGSVLAGAQNAILASWYQDPQGYPIERFTELLVSSLLRGMLSPKRPELEDRERRAAIREIDSGIRRFFEERIPAVVYSIARQEMGAKRAIKKPDRLAENDFRLPPA
jgi:AcrR family transcriptional regulator